MARKWFWAKTFWTRSGFHVHSGLWRQANQDATESIKPDLVISFSVSSLSLLLHLHPWPLSSNLLNTPHRQSSHIVKMLDLGVLNRSSSTDCVLNLDFQLVILSRYGDCSWPTDIFPKTGSRSLLYGEAPLILCAQPPFLSSTRPPSDYSLICIHYNRPV